MRKVYPEIALETLCRLFGYTRQAYYGRQNRQSIRQLQEGIILDLVYEIRLKIPRIGGKKLFFMLEESFEGHGIQIGRDRFFDLLRAHDLLIKPRRNRAITTMSYHHFRKYDNLIIGFIPDGPNQLWLSDITYIKVGQKWNYVIFITDAYSRKVVGYHVHDRPTAAFCLKALEMALRQWEDRTQPLMHHSDRGIQYCSTLYTERLKEAHIQISMTQKGDPRENALAQRVNGIFKGDFLMDKPFESLKQAQQEIQQMVYHYNHTRPHASCDFLTPQQAHLESGILKKRWKNYYQNAKNET